LDIEKSFGLSTGEVCSLGLVRDVRQLHEVGRFRYKEHVIRLKKPAAHADHGSRVLIEPFDVRSTIIVARTNGNMVGVVRVSPPRLVASPGRVMRARVGRRKFLTGGSSLDGYRAARDDFHNKSAIQRRRGYLK
jgi:hypothetical protein